MKLLNHMFVVYCTPTSIEALYVKLHLKKKEGKEKKDILEVIYSSKWFTGLNTMRLHDQMQFASSGFLS